VAISRPELEAALGHSVLLVVPPDADHPATIAVSVVGEPSRVRAAWVRDTGEVLARVGCPPGVPSAVRPAIGTIVEVAENGVSDRVILGRVSKGITAARLLVADPDPISMVVAASGLLAARIPTGIAVVALEALSSEGEPIGRLDHTGFTELRLVAGRLEGRLGSGHGMAAGFGAGDTVADLATAELEAGYAACLPTWLPDGFSPATVRVEPEAAYPFAPPSIAMSWTGDGDSRVLLRQCPGPLAVPELPDARGRAVDLGIAVGVLRGRGRGMSFVVWEAGDRAFGLQVRGVDDLDAVAVMVASSVPAAPAPPMT